MAVQEQTPYIEHIANGVTTLFALGFVCDSADKLVVTVNDLPTNVGDWSFSDGNVVFQYPPLLDSLVKIWRNSPLARSTTFKTYDNSLNPNSLNLDLDKIWLVMQELNVKNFISDNKLQELLDKLVDGDINGLPAEVLARIAGDESIKSLVNLEAIRAYQAESNLSVRIDNESLLANQNILAEKQRAEAAEQGLQIQVNSVGVGNKAYKTYALMDADKVSIPAKSKVTVTNDATESNNGDWQWDGVAFTKSAYDPLTQAKEFTKSETAVKQDIISPDNTTLIDFSAYLQVGNINETTGLLENQGFLNRRSIVGFPVEQGKYYNLQNLADTASNLRVAWFSSLNELLSIEVINAGQVSDLLLTPVANAAFVSIGLKSGNTDNIKFDETKVNFYQSNIGFTIERINGFKVKDPELTASVERLNSQVKSDNELFSEWGQSGLASTGGSNFDTTQSHLDYFAVEAGDVLTSDTRPMFRINLYDVNMFIISQGGFTGGTSYTIPSGLGVAFVRVSMEVAYTSNTATVTRTPAKTKIDQALILAKKSQEQILPDNVATIDFSAYLQVGNISSTTGLLEGQNFSNRRSIIDFPLEQGKYYNLQNLADTVSNLRVAWFSSSNELLSISTISAGGMVSWNFTAPQNAVKVNITIKSGNTDGQPYDSNKIKFFKSTSELKVKRINGFELAGANASGTDPDAIKQVIVGGLYANKTGNIVTINSATAQQSGLMSAADKAKLDALINGTITINGSGVTKNAAAFGFLPTNNADENVTALKAAAEGGGTILIDYPGVYDINESIPLESNTLILFGAKVYINKVLYNGKSPRYTFINKGAYTREWNENIILKNLKIICNGIGNGGDGTPSIPGLRGHVAMFYIRNFELDNFELLDGDADSYVVHICTFENIKITGPHIEGWKDAIHLGNGKTFLIRDGQFRTYDDPIALNAHDYATGQPELGWVENGLIENCYDLDDPIRGTTGYFARILAGAWVDWFSGMVVQQSDTVVASNGKMYRVSNGVGETTVYYTSTTEPSHATGTVELDGIKWTMCQENGITHTVGVRNVKFKDIFLQKDRSEALSIHFDTGRFSRSYYPNAAIPVQENITFEGLHVQAEIPTLVSAITPLKNLKIINSEIGESQIKLKNVNTAGMVYQPLNILMMGNTFMGVNNHNLVECDSSRTARVKILGSIKENDSYSPTFGAGVTVLASDL